MAAAGDSRSEIGNRAWNAFEEFCKQNMCITGKLLSHGYKLGAILNLFAIGFW